MKRILMIVAVIVIVAGVYLFGYKKQASIVTTETIISVSPTPTPQELLTWTDQAGFTFQYPKDVTVDKHDEDQENYAHIEMTHKDQPGTIIIWAKDTTAADSAGWVKKEKSLSGGTVFDTSLGGISGKKVLLSTPKKVIVSGVIDEGVVFYVEGSFQDSPYWTNAYDTITSSFTFVKEKQTAPAGTGAGDGGAVDEEVVVE